MEDTTPYEVTFSYENNGNMFKITSTYKGEDCAWEAKKFLISSLVDIAGIFIPHDEHFKTKPDEDNGFLQDGQNGGSPK